MEVKKTILVVDDKPNNLNLVTSLIKSFYEVLLANNGERALLIANEKKPDLILLDIMMPGLSGFEVCAQLKQSEATAEIPVIFLTAKNSGEDYEKAYEMGGVDYVTKPINAKELLARVKTHLTISDQYHTLQKLNERIASMNLSLEAEVKERTFELQKAYEYLERHTRDLERASNIISHNLRGPVASILGLCKSFNRIDLSDPTNIQILDYLDQSTLSLDEIVRDLSSIVSIRDSRSLKYKQHTLLDIIRATLESLDEEIKNQLVQFEISVEEELKLQTDQTHLTDILFQLISNAIHHRSDRPPRIKIQSTKNENRVVIRVIDNGKGIDKENWEQVFEPYKRFTTEPPGKGLGLYLAKGKTEALQGELYIEKSDYEGTCFVLDIPDNSLKN